MHPSVIGFGYQARVGKDTVCSHIETKFFSVRRRAFADSLKEACGAIFGFDREQLHGSLKEEVDEYWGFSPRHALQLVGTDGLRRLMDDVWVKSWEQHIRLNSVRGVLWLVPDVRFPNEVEAIKRAGGIVVRIDRPVHMRDREVVSHESERALDDYKGWDAVINNDVETLAALYGKVDRFLSRL